MLNLSLPDRLLRTLRQLIRVEQMDRDEVNRHDLLVTVYSSLVAVVMAVRLRPWRRKPGRLLKRLGLSRKSLPPEDIAIMIHAAQHAVRAVQIQCCIQRRFLHHH